VAIPPELELALDMRLREEWEVLEPLLEELEPELVAVIGSAMRAAYIRGRCEAGELRWLGVEAVS
jgi:hypothetical protein